MTPDPLPASAARGGSRRPLYLLFAVFLLPVVAAVVAYSLLIVPAGRTNYGELIVPARPMPEFALQDVEGHVVPMTSLRGKWSFIHVGGAECDEACLQRVVLFRQIRLALGKDLARVQRLYLAPDASAAQRVIAQLGRDHPDLRVLVDAGAPGARAADFFDAGRDPLAVCVGDPNGNWLLRYAGAVDPKGVYGDLHKLLRLSMIG